MSKRNSIGRPLDQMIWAVINSNYNSNFIQLIQNGDDELSRNEFMGLALFAEEYVDPADVLALMRFTDQNYDNHIQHWEFIEAMEYFQELGQEQNECNPEERPCK